MNTKRGRGGQREKDELGEPSLMNFEKGDDEEAKRDGCYVLPFVHALVSLLVGGVRNTMY